MKTNPSPERQEIRVFTANLLHYRLSGNFYQTAIIGTIRPTENCV